MKVIRPIIIENAMVTSTTVTEEHPDWSSSVTYNTGQIVVRGDNIYQSIFDSNVNKDPLSEPTWWVRIGPSNKMAMFDGQIVGATVAEEEFTVVVEPGSLVDSIAFVGLVGNFIQVTIRDGGPTGAVGYNEIQPLTGGQSVSWYQYFFFDPFLNRTQAVFLNELPPFLNPHITIKIWGVGQVEIGEATIGRKFDIGCAQYGARAGIIDFSRKETDEFGTTEFVRRAFSKRVSCDVVLQNREINRVQRTLYDLRATPSIWIVTDDPQLEEPMVVYGFYRDFSTQIAYPNHSVISIEIEGLI